MKFYGASTREKEAVINILRLKYPQYVDSANFRGLDFCTKFGETQDDRLANKFKLFSKFLVEANANTINLHAVAYGEGYRVCKMLVNLFGTRASIVSKAGLHWNFLQICGSDTNAYIFDRIVYPPLETYKVPDTNNRFCINDIEFFVEKRQGIYVVRVA